MNIASMQVAVTRRLAPPTICKNEDHARRGTGSKRDFHGEKRSNA
jgi:hypothetical protein